MRHDLAKKDNDKDENKDKDKDTDKDNHIRRAP